MKALFLDVDGVLNSGEWLKAGNLKTHGPHNLCPEMVKRVAAVVRRTGCEVVLSSTWRIGRYNELRRYLFHNFGDPFRIADCTPTGGRRASGLYEGHARGAEIAQWLSEHPEVRCFAIIDDDSDMGPLIHRLVQTMWTFGIQEEHVEELVQLLGEEGTPT